MDTCISSSVGWGKQFPTLIICPQMEGTRTESTSLTPFLPLHTITNMVMTACPWLLSAPLPLTPTLSSLPSLLLYHRDSLIRILKSHDLLCWKYLLLANCHPCHSMDFIFPSLTSHCWWANHINRHIGTIQVSGIRFHQGPLLRLLLMMFITIPFTFSLSVLLWWLSGGSH